MADPVPTDLTPEERMQQQRVLEAIAQAARNYRTAASTYYCMLAGFAARMESQPGHRLSAEEEQRRDEAWARMANAGIDMQDDAVEQGRQLGVPEDISARAAWAIMREMEDQFTGRKLECPVASLETEPARPSRSFAGVAAPRADT